MIDGISDSGRPRERNFKIYLSVLFLITTYIVLFIFWGSLSKYDTILFLEIYGNRINAIESLSVLWTNIGSFFFIFLITVILWINGAKKPATYLSLGLLVDAFLVGALKTMIHRPAPYEALSIMPLEFGDNFGCMPSGHTSRAFLSAMILSNFYSKYTVILFAVAASIGISRLYIGVHYPLDVIVGAINGSMIGNLMVDLLDRFEVRKQD